MYINGPTPQDYAVGYSYIGRYPENVFNHVNVETGVWSNRRYYITRTSRGKFIGRRAR